MPGLAIWLTVPTAIGLMCSALLAGYLWFLHLSETETTERD